ncbi:hypothetical protein JCM17823_14920 [Halorubrum gandharaense]
MQNADDFRPDATDSRPAAGPGDATDHPTTRRRFLAATGATALAGSLAGCAELDFVRGSSAMEYTAEHGTVADAALSETGYELHELDEEVVTETFTFAGRNRDVSVTTAIAEYDRGVDLSFVDQRLQAAVFSVVSTPSVSVLGRPFNPVAEMDTDELAERMQDSYENVRNLERDGETTVEVLGEPVEVARFVGEATLVNGSVSVDIVLHVSEPTAAGDDLVVCVGAYPAAIDDEAAVRTLLEGVEHPGV